MEFKQLEAFVNVVKLKSFSKAAEATFLTQPTISTHINMLEKELGVTLIDRHGKESRPTKEGRAFYNYAINILNTRERAVAKLGDFANEISGTLDIKTSTIPGEFIVPSIVAKFNAEFPNARFNIEESDSEKVCNDILDNLGEIGFTGKESSNNLKYELILQDKLVLITPDNEKFRAIKEGINYVTVGDIKDEMFILREDGSATKKTFEDAISQKYGISELKVFASVNSIEAVKKYVALGLGVSVLSEVCVDENQGYLFFEFGDLDLLRNFYMVYNKNTTLSPIAHRFKDFVIERIANV
ncbi:MAG: LysR family transcriptional regulator [Clostridia bacterium]|nr:LysR family transcriptional regulator [Clostridia bacterium]